MRLSLEHDLPESLMSIKEKARLILDHFAVYVVIGTVLGARIGHFLFYEHPSRYLRNPLGVLKVWEGGLASHGAVVGILIAIIVFQYWVRKIAPKVNWIVLLDLISVPTALAGCFIRLGNFFNQEIAGTVTSVPWAIIFGHPFDGSIPAPRHPVQLYEALFYLLTFGFLWFLSKNSKILFRKGRLIGVFFLLIFTFRFFVEFYKEKQSSLLLSDHWLTMGQILSIPVVLLGVIFYFLPKGNKLKKKARS